MRRRGIAVEPRDYQVEAAEWALSRPGAVVVMPTGSGKTVVAALWIRGVLEAGEARRVLVLEPTRILVEQAARALSRLLGIRVEAIHGVRPRGERRGAWARARVAVATPEAALSDLEYILEAGYDAVVVDECHHTTGKDAYAVLMRRLRGRLARRLGLTAYIPPHRRGEVEGLIGEVRVWSWSDPRIARHLPPWTAEVYEAELNEAEARLYEALRDAWAAASGRERALAANAMRWLARDGAEALRESVGRSPRLAAAIAPAVPLLRDPRVRPAHKLDALKRALDDHEGAYTKAIVFVERVVIADLIAASLPEYNPVVVKGRRASQDDPARTLERARSPRARLIVSTSAGEEGLDLPEADLLVVWSSVASPLRFIQRHGRMLRAARTAPGPPKTVVYLVTPDTVDMDSLVDSLELARRAGVHVPVDEEVLERLWRRTSRTRILALLQGNPMPLEWIAEAAGLPLDAARRALARLQERGQVVYIYTHLGRTYALPEDIEILEEQYQEYLDPHPQAHATIKARLPDSTTKTIRGGYATTRQRLHRLLQKHGAIKALHAAVQAPLPTGTLALVNLHYNYLMDTPEKLDLALKNAYTAHKLHKLPRHP